MVHKYTIAIDDSPGPGIDTWETGMDASAALQQAVSSQVGALPAIVCSTSVKTPPAHASIFRNEADDGRVVVVDAEGGVFSIQEAAPALYREAELVSEGCHEFVGAELPGEGQSTGASDDRASEASQTSQELEALEALEARECARCQEAVAKQPECADEFMFKTKNAAVTLMVSEVEYPLQDLTEPDVSPEEADDEFEDWIPWPDGWPDEPRRKCTDGCMVS
jgi:hypothetical protein